MDINGVLTEEIFGGEGGKHFTCYSCDCYHDEFLEIVCYKAQYYLGKAYDVLNLRLIKVLFSFLRFYCSIFSYLSHIVVGCVLLYIVYY
jgi:hypothetical protein